MKEFLTINLPVYLIIVIVCYLFLSLCNWDIWIGDWNGFSRVLQAIVTFSGMRIFFWD